MSFTRSDTRLHPPRREALRAGAVALALVLALAPRPSEAIAPVLLVLVKQLVQDAAKTMLKDMLLSSLRDMGCKGIALANAIEALDLRKGLGGGAGLIGMTGIGALPGLPAGMAMPGLPGMPSGMPSLPGLPAGIGAGGSGALTLSGGLPMGAGGPADLAAKMRSLMPGAGQLPADLLGPEQGALMAEMLQGMGRPLGPAETVATIDEMAELGFLPKAIQSELKECMVVLPSSIAALGMGMAMMKPILPQLRQARAELHALSPSEQDEVAQVLIGEMRELPAEEKAALLGALDNGFFPPRVVAAAKAAAASR